MADSHNDDQQDVVLGGVTDPVVAHRVMNHEVAPQMHAAIIRAVKPST